jgi:hypothetical protein
MTLGNILIYLALIVYILAKKVKGQPIGGPKKLFLLPVIVTILGYGDVTHGTMKSVAITVTVIGAVLSLGLGMLRGKTDKLSVRDGAPFVQWGTASLSLFVGTLVVKLAVDLVGVAAGSTASAVGKSLVLTFGLTLLGEAAVLWLRSEGSSYLRPPQPIHGPRP